MEVITLREPRSIVTKEGLAQVAPELRRGEEEYNDASVTPLVKAARLVNPLVELIAKFLFVVKSTALSPQDKVGLEVG
jgi:hypothetical protein